MRTALCLAASVALGWSLQHPASSQGDAPRDAAQPAELWKQRCATCHSVPDPALRADRAWLDQVRRTT